MIDHMALVPAVEDRLLARGGVRRGSQVWFPCPSPDHDDLHPSAAFNPRWGVWACESRGCHERMGGGGVLALAKALGIDTSQLSNDISPERDWRKERFEQEMRERRARITETHQWWSATTETAEALLAGSERGQAYLARRGVSPGVARRFRLGWRVDGHRQALQIPYLVNGVCHAVQYRYDDEGTIRYKFRTGAEMVLWNGGAVSEGPCLIVEGALKALAIMSSSELRVMAVPSKSFAPKLARWLSARGRAGVPPWVGHVVWLDPDASVEARQLALAIDSRMVEHEVKPDDLLALGGWDYQSVMAPIIKAAQRPL